MSKVNYYLKNAPSEKMLQELASKDKKAFNDELNTRRPIIMSIAFNGEREFFSTGKSIQLKFWSRSEKRIKDVLATPKDSLEDRKWLDEKKIEVEDYLKKVKSERRSATKGELHNIISESIKPKSDNPILDDILAEFLSEHTTREGLSLKPNTIKKYITLIRHIKDFQGNDCFTPHLYTKFWVEDFRKFLLIDRKRNDNSIAKYRAALKTFFRHFQEKGINIPVKCKEIIVKEREQIVIPLLLKELKALEDIVLENKTHDEIRDIFLFQCYTGARFSDVDAINPNAINGIYWDYISIKNSQEITAPIADKARVILEKYKHLDTPLPRYTNQFVNDEIKKIAKLAGLDRRVQMVSYYDNIKYESWHLLHDVISCHKGRKTFITISLQDNLSERYVREATGHKDERSFRRYVNFNKSHIEVIVNAQNKR